MECAGAPKQTGKLQQGHSSSQRAGRAGSSKSLESTLQKVAPLWWGLLRSKVPLSTQEERACLGDAQRP